MKAGAEREHFGQVLSFYAGLAGSILVAVLTFGLIFGFSRLDPLNTEWIGGDFLQTYLGWSNYRLEPEPAYMMRTSRLSTPIPVNIALFDLVPILAFGLKLISSTLPEHIQYVGPYVFAGAVLQAIFAFLIFHDAARRHHHPEPTAALFSLMAAVFIAAAPILIWRWQGHLSSSHQWPLLAAFWLYFRADRMSVAGELLGFALLFVLLGASNVYISLMLAFIYGGLLLRWIVERSMTPSRMAACLLPPAAGLASMMAFGFFSFGSGGFLPGGGYGYYSTNLLSLIDPQNWPATFLPQLPSSPGQYEGYGYLGFGAIVMIVLSVGLAARAGKLKSQNVIPLGAVGVLAFLFALSTTVKMGTTTLATVPLPHVAYELVSQFRCSGRFIWIVNHLIIIAGAMLLAKTLPSRALVVTLAALLAIQVVDLVPTWAAMGEAIGKMRTPHFRASVWNELKGSHQALLALPPWQCDTKKTPDGIAGYGEIGSLALESGLVTNNFYNSRAPRDVWEYQCEAFAKHFEDVPIRSNAAYVMEEEIFLSRGLQLTVTHRCELADGLVLCRSGKPGYGPKLSTLIARLTVEDGTVLSPDSAQVEEGLSAGWKRDSEGRLIMSGARAHLELRSMFPTKQPVQVSLGLRDSREIGSKPVSLDVYVGSAHAGTMTLQGGPVRSTFHVPGGLLRQGSLFGITLVRQPGAPRPSAAMGIEFSELSFSDADTVEPVTSAQFSFNKRVADRALLINGWSGLENWGVWSEGDRAALRIPVLAGARRVTVDAKIQVFADRSRGLNEQHVKVSIGGQLIDTLVLGPATHSIRLQLPTENAGDDAALRLDLEFPNATSPSQIGMSSDKRRLAIGLQSIVVSAAD